MANIAVSFSKEPYLYVSVYATKNNLCVEEAKTSLQGLYGNSDEPTPEFIS